MGQGAGKIATRVGVRKAGHVRPTEEDIEGLPPDLALSGSGALAV